MSVKPRTEPSAPAECGASLMPSGPESLGNTRSCKCWMSGLSRRERAARLLHMGGLGDRKPSQLMSEMLALMDGHEPCFLFQAVFLEQMPEDIRLLLVLEDFSDPRRVAAKADDIWQSKQCRAARSAHPKAQAPQPKPLRPTAEKDESLEQWCFYHRRWGSSARHCRPPCAFPGNARATCR